MFILKTVLLFLVIFGLTNTGFCIRCFECVSRLGPGESSPCLTGDGLQLSRVRCIGPSVCATYHFQSIIPGTPTISHVTRGCQALRYGGTCEDIFYDLRSKGEILPGQHTCATCSSDLCNNAVSSGAVLSVLLIFAILVLYF